MSDEEVRRIRNAALEEAADLCDQNLDHLGVDGCVYRCDVAEAIRELKEARFWTAVGERLP